MQTVLVQIIVQRLLCRRQARQVALGWLGFRASVCCERQQGRVIHQ
ncbi:hypothetical protein [Nitrosomonas sp. Nm34]|nr:hypothetical protein [Nitrosomonas sp. Nm34]